MTEEKKDSGENAKKEDGDEFVLVYDEDEGTKRRLDGMGGYEVVKWKYNRRNKVYDVPLVWRVPKKVLLRRGITTVMSEKEASRRCQEKNAYRTWMGEFDRRGY